MTCLHRELSSAWCFKGIRGVRLVLCNRPHVWKGHTHGQKFWLPSGVVQLRTVAVAHIHGAKFDVAFGR